MVQVMSVSAVVRVTVAVRIVLLLYSVDILDEFVVMRANERERSPGKACPALGSRAFRNSGSRPPGSGQTAGLTLGLGRFVIRHQTPNLLRPADTAQHTKHAPR